MATTITKYTSYNQYVHNGVINLNSTGNIKLALVTSSYTPNIAHTLFDNGADNATDPSYNEVATGNGYTTGGAVVGSLSVDTTRWDSADVSWTALTKTFRYGILYLDATVLTIARPLIAYISFEAGSDVVISGSDFVVQVNASGWITF